MSRLSQKLVGAWSTLGTRFLPFADVASAELPLPRLLRLSLFQVSVGMALVLLVGTLNRVMIVELKVPAALVAVMVAMPLLFAPFRALVGFRSDNHRSELGWRRVPYVWMGTLMQFGGLSIMPFALLVLAGAGQSPSAPPWVGQLSAAIAFFLVGAGLHTVQTVGLALATDLAPPEDHPKVVGFMYVMLLLGSIGSAFAFADFLSDYSPGRLIQVIQAAAITTLVLNVVAMWKQEARSRSRKPRAGDASERASFAEAWRGFAAGGDASRRLWVIALGTMAFTMEDVLLEPYGGEILGMSVSSTTYLTATLALGGWWASAGPRACCRVALIPTAWPQRAWCVAYLRSSRSSSRHHWPRWRCSWRAPSSSVWAPGCLATARSPLPCAAPRPNSRAWRWVPGAQRRPPPGAWPWPWAASCVT